VTSFPESPAKSSRSISLRDQLVAASAPDSPKTADGMPPTKPGAAEAMVVRGSTGAAPVTPPSLLRRKPLPKFHQSQFYTKPFDTAYADLAKARNLRRLETLFVEADADGSGEMSFDEFRDALRVPRIQRAFSVLGVQPHQSEPIFRFLDKHGTGELSITAFMSGLTELVGTDVDGTGKELDVETLRPAYKSKVKHHSHYQQTQPIATASTAVSPTATSKQFSMTRTKTPGDLGNALELGPVHLLPKAKVQRAFVHSASAQALHSATSLKK